MSFQSTKVVILAGGEGSRISEESIVRPKPMIEIGEKPILWHIMKIYSHFGFNEFLICLGYRGYCIKDFFTNFFVHGSDVTFDFTEGRSDLLVHEKNYEPWRVTLVDTGRYTMTGGRLKRVSKYLNNETFLMTYGDGLADINIRELLEFHIKHGRLATVTGVQPSGRFGALKLGDSHEVTGFDEKPKGDRGWINGGFFVFEPKFLEFIKDDETILERSPLVSMAEKRQLMVYKHSGFWHAMDTLRDRQHLEALWKTGNAPWQIWGSI